MVRCVTSEEYHAGSTEPFRNGRTQKIEISFVGSSPVAKTPASDHTPTPAIPAFTALAAIAGMLIVTRMRVRR